MNIGLVIERFRRNEHTGKIATAGARGSRFAGQAPDGTQFAIAMVQPLRLELWVVNARSSALPAKSTGSPWNACFR